MSFINRAGREINLKVVYVGPGMSGKTTNVQTIFDQTQTENRGRLMTMSGENERTLFFDFLPLSVGEIQGYKVRFHLYTVPGQTFYEVSHQFILKGIDGVVFVADSAPERMEANLESRNLLERSLERQGYDLVRLPMIMQYNKRDLSPALSVRELEATLNPMHRPYFEAVASRGEGVMETLEAICQWVIRELKGEQSKPQAHP